MKNRIKIKSIFQFPLFVLGGVKFLSWLWPACQPTSIFPLQRRSLPAAWEGADSLSRAIFVHARFWSRYYSSVQEIASELWKLWSHKMQGQFCFNYMIIFPIAPSPRRMWGCLPGYNSVHVFQLSITVLDNKDSCIRLLACFLVFPAAAGRMSSTSYSSSAYRLLQASSSLVTKQPRLWYTMRHIQNDLGLQFKGGNWRYEHESACA